MVNISTCAFPCEQENNLGSLTVETREKECLSDGDCYLVSILRCPSGLQSITQRWMQPESNRGTENTQAQAPSDPWFIKTQQSRLKYTNIPNMWADM